LKAYLTLRKWIDRDLSAGQRLILRSDGKTEFNAGYYGRPGGCYFLVVVPMIAALTIEGFPVGGPSTTSIFIAFPISAAIFTFIAWRQVRMLKARAIKSGRYYERKARYELPPEYSNSEDAFLAKRRNAQRN